MDFLDKRILQDLLGRNFLSTTQSFIWPANADTENVATPKVTTPPKSLIITITSISFSLPENNHDDDDVPTKRQCLDPKEIDIRVASDNLPFLN
jgi:hypothetical protein